MRRIVLVLSLVAMLVASAVPVMAQGFDFDDGEGFFFVDDEDALLDEGLFFDDPAVVGQEFELEDVESGDVEPVVDISNTGNNANLCPTVLQSSNTGNIQNAQGVVQYQSEADDIEFEGSSIEIASEASGECTQTIEQAVTVW